jgi:LAS superfamily LD-carboxypeptidase LdcB
VLWLQDAVGNSAVARAIENGSRPGPVTILRKKARPATPEGLIPSSKLRKMGTAEETRFKRAVYEAQVAKSVADPSKQFSRGLEDDEKAEVENGEELRKDVVPDAQKLLAAARADLQEAKRKGDTAATAVVSIGIASAYRPLARDFGAWQDTFKNVYDNTEDERAALKGGEYGAAAVALMVRRLYELKAIPGFSKHSKGLAIDFTTTQGKWRFVPSASQSDGWKKTWLFRWLQRKAADYSFEPYEKEPWHWSHKDTKAEQLPGPPSEAEKGLAAAIREANRRGLAGAP